MPNVLKPFYIRMGFFGGDWKRVEWRLKHYKDWAIDGIFWDVLETFIMNLVWVNLADVSLQSKIYVMHVFKWRKLAMAVEVVLSKTLSDRCKSFIKGHNLSNDIRVSDIGGHIWLGACVLAWKIYIVFPIFSQWCMSCCLLTHSNALLWLERSEFFHLIFSHNALVNKRWDFSSRVY